MEIRYRIRGTGEVVEVFTTNDAPLHGQQSITTFYGESSRTDTFVVGACLDSSYDEAKGLYCRAYEIFAHNTYVDNGSGVTQNRMAVADVEDAMCSAEIDAAEWRAGVEDALCEIDEREGNDNG